MKYYLFIFIVSTMNIVSAQKKSYNINYIKAPHLLDSIEYSTPFVIHNTNDTNTNLAQFKMAWDSLNLYVKFNVEDSIIESYQIEHDSHIFKTDDCIELFLDFNGDGKNYLELGVNPRGVYYDYLINTDSQSGSGNNPDLDLKKVKITADIQKRTGYTVKIIIPFSSLKPLKNKGYSYPINETIWKGNLFNINPTIKAYNAWSATKTFGFHQPDFFGKFVFKK